VTFYYFIEMEFLAFTDLETVEVTIDSVGITPPPGTTGTVLSPDCAKNVQRLLLKPQDECWTNWR
jgi:hypothetical protein